MLPLKFNFNLEITMFL